jgi:hypothetical protein
MWLNIGSLFPVALTGVALAWMVVKQRSEQKNAPATSA